MCLCECLLPCNLKENFVSLLDESSDGKNVSPSDKTIVGSFGKYLHCREMVV